MADVQEIYGEEATPDPLYLPVLPSSPVTRLIAGFTMLPHVQAYADAMSAATGAVSMGTYNGHDPAANQAIDVFTPVDSTVLGDKITAFAIQHFATYGIRYIIYRQRIYNPEIGTYWRAMEDRGSNTQNHFDHVHHSFYATGGDWNNPKPPITTGDAMSLAGRYTFEGLDWVFDGPSRIWAAVGTKGVLVACDKSKVVEWGPMDKASHEWFRDVASLWDGRD